MYLCIVPERTPKFKAFCKAECNAGSWRYRGKAVILQLHHLWHLMVQVKNSGLILAPGKEDNSTAYSALLSTAYLQFQAMKKCLYRGVQMRAASKDARIC